MTRKLEDLFNLPEDAVPEKRSRRKPSVDPVSESQPDPLEKAQEIMKNNRLPNVALGTKTDIELDDIAENAKQTYDDLMDLGMNVDSRYSARIFEVASAFLKISLDAKSTKVNKLLRTAELELKQERSFKQSSNTMVGVDHVVSDRNSLLEKIRKLS